MSETLLPMEEDGLHRLPMPGPEPSLITTLGVAEGDVLAYVETHGPTPLRVLTHALGWPARMVLMAVGGLVRERRVRSHQGKEVGRMSLAHDPWVRRGWQQAIAGGSGGIFLWRRISPLRT